MTICDLHVIDGWNLKIKLNCDKFSLYLNFHPKLFYTSMFYSVFSFSVWMTFHEYWRVHSKGMQTKHLNKKTHLYIKALDENLYTKLNSSQNWSFKFHPRITRKSHIVFWEICRSADVPDVHFFRFFFLLRNHILFTIHYQDHPWS